VPDSPRPQLTVAVEDQPTGPVVRLIGELDAATADDVDAVAIAGTAGGVVRLELTGLSFVDSAGLRSLLALRQRATEAGLRLIAPDPSPIVVRLLEVTGLTELFPPA